METFGLMVFDAPPLYFPTPSTYTHQPVIVCPAVGEAEASTLTGEPTVALFAGVLTETVGLTAAAVTVIV